MQRTKSRRPWQPRVHDEAIFNPFAHTTEPEASLAEHHEYEELDELEAAPGDTGTGQPQGESVPAPQTKVDPGTSG